MKYFLPALCLLLFACSRQDLRPTEARLVGEWDFAYEYLPDGSTTDSFTTSFNLTHPYAMLSYAYSSGIILREDGSFQATWYSRPGAPGDFWSMENDTLQLTPEAGGTIYRFPISNLSQDGLDLENPGLGKWRLMRVVD